MSQDDRRSPFRITTTSETMLRREGMPDVENPYWELEEPPPHPDPSLGCVRRGLCCRSNPGWFAPGEVEAAAALLGLEPDAFVREHLVIDWLELDGEVVHVFAPAKVGRDGAPLVPPGTRVDVLYQAFRGTCTFYDGAGCRIYGARPLECRDYDCTRAPEDNPSHAEIARRWRGAAE